MNQSDSQDSVGQSANLRTRIAAVLSNVETHGDGDCYGLMADAVIRELNLDIATAYTTSQGREVCIEGFWTEEATND